LEGNKLAKKTTENIEVGFSETELIESTATDSQQQRVFQITNGAKEIIATVHGSEDNVIWSSRESKNISPNTMDQITLEINHDQYIKLVARTTKFGDSSIVDTTFTFTPSSNPD
jgi:hypothetical protein